MRILHVIQELRTGGAERVVISVSRGAQAAGHEIAVAAGPGELTESIDAEVFPVRLIQRHPLRVAGAALDVHRAIHAWKPDVVHVHNPGMALATGVATLRGGRVRGLVTVHGNPEKDWPAAARVVRLSGLPAVACGPGVAAALEEHGCRPLTTIPNAVGPAPPPADRSALERAWGLAPGQPLIVNVGRLVHQKNQTMAVRALARVPEAALAIVGDGPLRPELEREAAELGVGDRVVLTGGRTDARAIMGAADAILMTSHWEGLSLVAIEALAAGTPLVATAVRGVRELLVDGREGLLAPPDDPEELGAALRRVLEDRELASRLAANGRRLAAEATEEKMLAAYLDVYARVAA